MIALESTIHPVAGGGSSSNMTFDLGGKSPLVVAYGLGVDSTAMLVGYWRRVIRPDLIVFSDVGAEREATYGYLPIINAWLRSVGFPEVTVVRYVAKDFKHWPHYETIEENILTNVSLPAIAYGGHSCSSKWKISAQDAFLGTWPNAMEAWSLGVPVLRAVGFEDSPHEHKRAHRCATFSVQDLDAAKYRAVFPLQEWHWDRARCIEEIKAAGLPVPSKSSCYFCTAMKPWEVDELTRSKHMRIVIIEARTSVRHIDYVINKRAELEAALAGDLLETDRVDKTKALLRLPPNGKPLTEGLWRKAVKGCRGATPKPGSMTEYIRQKGHLPSALIDALIELTPTHTFTREDFDKMGIAGWQEWIARICADAEAKALATTTADGAGIAVATVDAGTEVAA